VSPDEVDFIVSEEQVYLLIRVARNLDFENRKPRERLIRGRSDDPDLCVATGRRGEGPRRGIRRTAAPAGAATTVWGHPMCPMSLL